MEIISKTRFYLYFSLLVVAIAAILLLRHWILKDSSVRDLGDIIKTKELIVITDYNSIGYTAVGDSCTGFQYELIKLFAEEIGVQAVIHVDVDLERSIEGLINGKYDLIARPIPIVSELRSRVNFTEPLLISKQVLVQHVYQVGDSASILRNQLMLAGKTVHISANSVANYRLQNLIQEIGDTIFVVKEGEYNDEKLMGRVANREVQYAVIDQYAAQKYAQKYDSLDIKTPISFSQMQSWATNKKSKRLNEELDIFIQKITESGQLEALRAKYYKPEK